MTVFLRVMRQNKARQLWELAHGVSQGERFDVATHELAMIPRTPFAYWIGEPVRELFKRSSLGSVGVTVKQGLATSDDYRFVRCWWEAEISRENLSWRPFAKGGSFSPYYSNLDLVIRWSAGDEVDAGRELKAWVETTPGTRHWTRRIPSSEFYGRPGLTYPRRLQRLAVSPLPEGSVISVRGSGIYAERQQLAAVAGLLSSSSFDMLVKCALGRFGHPQFDNGTLERTPVPSALLVDGNRLGEAAIRGIRNRRRLLSSVETARTFLLPSALQVQGDSLGERLANWEQEVDSLDEELSFVQAEVDAICASAYGISAEDYESIVQGFASAEEDTEADDSEGDDGDTVASTAGAIVANVVSWCVGVGTGRFDVRLAIGDRSWPEEVDPFDALPVCSPGMLSGENGIPMETPPAGYPIVVSSVLVDDPGHALDVTARVRSVFDRVFGAKADAWWSDAGEALGARGREVGSWLSKGFFDHHLMMYSKSRRKAPLYWPLGTASGSYLVWLYAHQVTSDSLFRVLNDLVAPKVALERRRLSELVQESGPNPSASQRKAIEGQEKLVGELQEFLDELTAVAPLWHPDLNDGIVIVLAPLWRLFAHHKPWSKELRNHWVSLVAGEYDWAQLAMRLWPERVVPKCAKDRSLAIAHGLEDVFWIQDAGNPEKWHPRQEPTVSVDQLITDRSEAATKAALEDAVR